jgi:hypothetical protein
MKRVVPLLCFSLATFISAAETRKFAFDCEAWAEGDPPPREVMVVDGAVTVKAVNGNKVLEVGIAPMVEANVLLGSSANGGASITARVLATRAGRSFPRFGLGAHGQTGYRLMLAPGKKELQLTKGETVVKTVPFEWTSDAWTHLKLEVSKQADGSWSIKGKAWADGTAEPVEALISHEDSKLTAMGRCSLWATPFSGTPIDFDDVLLEVEEHKK